MNRGDPELLRGRNEYDAMNERTTKICHFQESDRSFRQAIGGTVSIFRYCIAEKQEYKDCINIVETISWSNCDFKIDRVSGFSVYI